MPHPRRSFMGVVKTMSVGGSLGAGVGLIVGGVAGVAIGLVRDLTGPSSGGGHSVNIPWTLVLPVVLALHGLVFGGTIGALAGPWIPTLRRSTSRTSEATDRAGDLHPDPPGWSFPEVAGAVVRGGAIGAPAGMLFGCLVSVPVGLGFDVFGPKNHDVMLNAAALPLMVAPCGGILGIVVGAMVGPWIPSLRRRIGQIGDETAGR